MGQRIVQLTAQERQQDLEEAVLRTGDIVLEKIEESLDSVEVEALNRRGRFEIGLITIADICDLYGISRQTFYKWDLEPVGLPGRCNLYRVDDITSQLEQQSEVDA